MIAQDLEVTLHLAFVEARKARHEDLTLEHLLYALLDNPTVIELLNAVDLTLKPEQIAELETPYKQHPVVGFK